MWMRELPGNAIREARTAAPVPTSHRRGFVVVTVAACVMTLAGAFGTDALGLLPRLGFWLVIMETGAMIGIGTTAGMRGWGQLAHHPWIEGAAISLLIAAPLTLVVLGTTAAFFGAHAPDIAGIASMFGMVLAVTGVVTAINYATARPVLPVAPAAPPAPDSGPRRPRLADRLPRHLRDAPIFALQAEDHYLRIHTEAGSELILMRMGDAIPELEGLEGARTHRSWWVSRDAIRDVTRKDGRAELTLPGGVIAPVSRSAYPELRDAGWFG
jgi:hypothetical protein